MLLFYGNIGRSFCCSKSEFLSEAPTLRFKKIVKWFLLYCVSISISLKNVSHILKIIFRTLDVNVFAHHGVISVLYFQIQSSLSGKKNPHAVESETRFCGKMLNFKMVSIEGKLYCLQNYAELAELRNVVCIEKLRCFCW